MNLSSLGRGMPARLFLLAALASATSGSCMAEAQRFRLQVYEDGVYRVDYEQLQAVGLAEPVASERLALENLGRGSEIRVDDGNDGEFGPGDSLIFIGRHLRGRTSHYHDHSPFNVYILATEAQSAPRRMTAATENKEMSAASTHPILRRSLHLERDLLRVPLSGLTGPFGDETLWYWKQLNHLASEPTRVPIDLSHFDPEGESAFSLKLQFRGWSDYASSAALSAPDHTVEVALNGNPIGQGSWQGREVHRMEISPISPSLVKDEENVIEIRVPARRVGDDETIIDVVYLDWIEATYPRDARLADRQRQLQIRSTAESTRLRLERSIPTAATDRHEPVEIFGSGGFYTKAQAESAGQDLASGKIAYETTVPAAEDDLWVVPDDRFKRLSRIEMDRPSNLKDNRKQRDYFIIAHRSLTEAVTPLTEFHERRGMSTEIVDVQDIYDEFNFGIEHPRAIRDFLAHARDNRQQPAPGHVLLVGDANWNAKDHGETAPDGMRDRDRVHIPTWQLRTRDGPAASDNRFVELTGDDIDPDMAIGRFPANTPAEVTAMVDKTIAYMRNPSPGPWQARVLLVSDRERNLSARNEQLARRVHEAGLRAEELLGDTNSDGERHQAQLVSAIDEGMLVLHFFGHGGRYMWQTAPSRGGDAGNLFDMEDLDRLAPNTRLPIVLSMSCNTGPFDHPAVDSLAEKFLRIQDRGAVAVLAASARNSPSLKFTNALMEGILHEETLGEAVRAAKSAHQHPDAVVLYNLLGDPALVPARP